ncbi:hypothetical protein [Segetibacter koreensis]|uniref:hypothetical protein n=1 Tax=Segetibacter koreensis TaxID=398037 RepID=UPI00036A3421|nr:hypothetical protein [Segetibacter koreensis]
MSNVLATWICIDDPEKATYFPSSKGNSADVSVQSIYWRCVAVFMYTARKFNPTLRLVFFSNVTEFPTINNVDYKILFKKLNVEFYTTPFEYQTPKGYYGTWSNQFYEFSILKFISDHPAFSNEDAFVLLDSDCLITKNLDNLFSSVVTNECITYSIDWYGSTYKINGNSRSDMKSIFEKLQGFEMDVIPVYHAGEFLGATIASIKKLMSVFYPTWEKLLDFHRNNMPRLHEEAHVLSYLYYKCGYKGGQANDYIKRMWTDFSAYRNVKPGDENYMIWHLPTEKRFGFEKMFYFLKKIDFDVHIYSEQQLIKYMKKVFQVPKISYDKYVYFLLKKTVKKLVK